MLALLYEKEGRTRQALQWCGLSYEYILPRVIDAMNESDQSACRVASLGPDSGETASSLLERSEFRDYFIFEAEGIDAFLEVPVDAVNPEHQPIDAVVEVLRGILKAAKRSQKSAR